MEELLCNDYQTKSTFLSHWRTLPDSNKGWNRCQELSTGKVEESFDVEKKPVKTGGESREKMHCLSPVSFEESFSSRHICITS